MDEGTYTTSLARFARAYASGALSVYGARVVSTAGAALLVAGAPGIAGRVHADEYAPPVDNLHASLLPAGGSQIVQVEHEGTQVREAAAARADFRFYG